MTQSEAKLKILYELKRKAEFTSCVFGDFEIPGKFVVHFPFALPCTVDELTNAIKESTRLYRESWILPLIDALIRNELGEVSLKELLNEFALDR